jgi:hypothetical protein
MAGETDQTLLATDDAAASDARVTSDAESNVAVGSSSSNAAT